MSLLRRIMIGIAIAAVSGGHLEAGGLREEPPSGPGVSIGSTSLPCVRRDAEGGVSTTPRSLMTKEGADVVVVIFVTSTCPIANATTPSIRRLHEAGRELGVDLVLVHPDPLVTPELASEHAGRRKLGMDVLLDADQRLARALGARVVPEAFVLQRADDGWQIRYRGPVDDLYADVGRRRRAATTFHVHDAIRRIRAGLPIERPVLKAHGCAIERMIGS